MLACQVVGSRLEYVLCTTTATRNVHITWLVRYKLRAACTCAKSTLSVGQVVYRCLREFEVLAGNTPVDPTCQALPRIALQQYSGMFIYT